MIAMRCYTCGLEFSVADDRIGQTAQCPRCRHEMRIAVAAAAPAASPAIAAGRLPLSGPLPAAIPVVMPDSETLVPAASGVDRAQPDTVGGEAVPPGTPREAYDFLSPPQAPDELGRLGPYRVLGVLGSGGMGVVFRAEDPRLHRLVALKAMLPTLAVSRTARERFQREAEAAAKLDDDHIVHIYDVGEDRGVPYLAMQFLKGEPLEALLARQPRLPLPDILRIGREIAQGLAAAHAQGLVHRDIKPGNIWLEAPPPHALNQPSRVKLLDFGLARAVSGDVSLTQSGAILGTPGYMAPEQSGRGADHRSDLFSLGCVLYRMTTGQLPFKGVDPVSTLIAVATEIPPPPRERNPAIPAALDRLIMQLLAKDAAERPASAAAVVDAFRTMEKSEAAPQPAPMMSNVAERIVQKIGRVVERLQTTRCGKAVAAPTPTFQRPSTPRPSRPQTAIPEVIPVRPPPPIQLPRPKRKSGVKRVVFIVIVAILAWKAMASLIHPASNRVTIREDGSTKVGDTVVYDPGTDAPGTARESAEKYLRKQFGSRNFQITSRTVKDSDHVVFAGRHLKGDDWVTFELNVTKDEGDHWECELNQ